MRYRNEDEEEGGGRIAKSRGRPEGSGPFDGGCKAAAGKGVVRLRAGTYAIYRGLLLECSMEGDRVIIHTTNDFIALMLGQMPSKWK